MPKCLSTHRGRSAGVSADAWTPDRLERPATPNQTSPLAARAETGPAGVVVACRVREPGEQGRPLHVHHHSAAPVKLAPRKTVKIAQDANALGIRESRRSIIPP